VQFRTDQRFDASPGDVLALYTDSAFYGALVGLPKISTPEVLSNESDGETVRLRIRYRFTADLPAAALAVIDPNKLTWVEESTYRLDELTFSSSLVPDHYPDRLVAGASGSIVGEGTDPVRTSRLVRGDVNVRMPFVGGQVERAIVSGLREHLADENQVAARWLRGEIG